MTQSRVPSLPVSAAWSIVALGLASQTWLSVSTHGHSFGRILFYQVVVWSMWAFLTPWLFGLARRVPLFPFDLRRWLVHCGVMLPVVAAHVIWWIATTIAIRPYDAMTQTHFGAYFPKTAVAQFPLEVVIYFAVIAVGHVVELRSRTARLEQSLAGARLHALELQIQPHFLFNTLNAISALVRARKNEEAVEVVAGLSDLLRYTLDHAGDGRVTLEQEIAMTQRYLEIQRVRFPDRLEVAIDIDDAARRGAVPTLILQPLAENAIRHGIARSAGAGRVELRACRRGGALEIEIFNTGQLTAAPRGIGLSNTEERLRQLYPGQHRFELRNERGGVVARISIPWSEAA